MARVNNLSMSFLDVMVVMSEGNPGAATAMLDMYEKSEQVDPDNIMGGLGNILSLDTHGIYGPRIWMFYSDVCKKSVNTMLGIMRAVQLGFLGEGKLNHAIDNYGEGLDVPALLKQVKDRLPRFNIGS